MPCHNRNGRMAIFSVRGGWGEGVYRESSCYFQTFHSSNINSEVGPKDPKLYFCNYFGAVFSFNVDGRIVQAALPLSSLRRLAGCAGDGEGGEGRWDRAHIGEQRGLPLAKCWQRLASAFGVGGDILGVSGVLFGRPGLGEAWVRVIWSHLFAL